MRICEPTIAIGIDLGGTNLRGAAVDKGGRVLAKRTCNDGAAGGHALAGPRKQNSLATAINEPDPLH